MKSYFATVAILFLAINSIGQEMKTCTDFDVNHKKREMLELVGEVGDNFVVRRHPNPMHYEKKKTNLFLLDQDFNIIKHREFSTLYKTGRGGILPENVQRFFTFQDRLFGYYSKKEKKDAVFYYDEYDPNTLETISQGNVLFKYTYPGLVNARDWIQVHFYQYGDEIVMHATIYGIVKGTIQAGNNQGAIIRLDKELKTINKAFYKEDEIGSMYDLELLDNGGLAFLSFDKDGDSFFLSSVDENGEITTSSYKKGSKYFDYWSHELLACNDGRFLFAGLYSDTEWGDKKNKSFQGIYMTENDSKEMNYISFESLSQDFQFSSEGYLKRKSGEAEMDVYFSKKLNTAYLCIYNTGKVSEAKLGVISYNMDDGSVKANEFEFPGGSFGYYEMEEKEDELMIKFFVSEERKLLVLNINGKNLEDPNWDTTPLKKVGSYYYIEGECALNCEGTYFYLVDTDGFQGVMKIEE